MSDLAEIVEWPGACLKTYSFHIDEFLFAGSQHQLTLIRTHCLEDALEDGPFVLGSLTRHSWVLVGFEHCYSALGAL